MRPFVLSVLLAVPVGAAVVETPAALGSVDAAMAASPTALTSFAPALSHPMTALSAPAPAFLPAAAAEPSLPMSRDIARDAAAAKLADAGFDRELAKHGLVLWHVLSAHTRSGDRTFLTVSLPPDDRPYDREDDPERRAELDRRLAAAQKRITAEAARILGQDEDMVGVNGRLIESCCGAGCQSCLLTKKEHAKKWTGRAARPPRE